MITKLPDVKLYFHEALWNIPWDDMISERYGLRTWVEERGHPTPYVPFFIITLRLDNSFANVPFGSAVAKFSAVFNITSQSTEFGTRARA